MKVAFIHNLNAGGAHRTMAEHAQRLSAETSELCLQTADPFSAASQRRAPPAHRPAPAPRPAPAVSLPRPGRDGPQLAAACRARRAERSRRRRRAPVPIHPVPTGASPGCGRRPCTSATRPGASITSPRRWRAEIRGRRGCTRGSTRRSAGSMPLRSPRRRCWSPTRISRPPRSRRRMGARRP